VEEASLTEVVVVRDVDLAARKAHLCEVVEGASPAAVAVTRWIEGEV